MAYAQEKTHVRVDAVSDYNREGGQDTSVVLSVKKVIVLILDAVNL